MKIYLAIPYSGFEEESFRVANRIAARLMEQGHIVVSPISYIHPIAKAGNLPTTWDYWEKFDKCFIEWCDEIRIVHMDIDGSKRIQNSKGVQAELKIAGSLGKPMFYEFDIGE